MGMNVFARLLIFVLIVSGVVLAWRQTHPASAPERVQTDPPAPPAEPESPPAPPAPVASRPLPEPPVQRLELKGDAASGVWTSRDGRKMKASYVSATETTVTVRREDGQVFTIPLANLSAGDGAWVARQSRPQGMTQKQLDELLARFPDPPGLGSEVTNDLQQLYEKYRGMVKFMRPNTVQSSLKMIRSKMVDDIKTLSSIAGTMGGDWSGKRLSGQSAAAENGILSARRSISWLQGPLTEHLRSYEESQGSSE
jgi:hypothetical protein